jgi:hypothetical protein
MPSDISRTSDEQRYDGIVMQQGRVILDRDVNALRQTIDRRIANDALDIIGPCGTPDDGFVIGPAPGTTSPASPPLWSPPLAPTSPPSAEPYDFSISAGTMYVGGQRAVFPPDVPGQGTVEYSYFDQPNWVSPTTPATPPNQEFIYLHLLENEVSAVEDPELKDVALGGPDTTQRLHLVKRVKRLSVGSADCSVAREEAARTWLAAGFVFEPQTMRLVPQATLQVSYADPSTATDPCDPIAQGGYLGADNQLIRVQVISAGPSGAPPGIVWGYDNASFLYRASVSPQTPTTVVLAQSPVDAFHIPQLGQVVEILRSAYIIDTEPNATDAQQADTIRCVAEAHGVICTLTAPYQPDTLSLSLDQSLPSEYLDDTNPLFVRIWQSQLAAVTADGTTLYPLQNADGSQTGVQITLGMQGNSLPIGVYWMFAVRPSTPQAVYPERFLMRLQPPDGPRQWICPLGTIDWTDGAISPPGSPPTSTPAFHDCRNAFCNLVDACEQHSATGCCSVTLRPEDLAADPTALQRAADQFLGAADGAAICLSQGTFVLSQPLLLTARHSGLTIEGCHGAVAIQASTNAKAGEFIQGLVIVAGADRITLKGLTFNPPTVELALALLANKNALASLGSVANEGAKTTCGLRVRDCTRLKVVGCAVELSPPAGGETFGAGIFVSGNCPALSVIANEFTSPPRVSTPSPVELRLSVNIGLPRAQAGAIAGILVAPAINIDTVPITGEKISAGKSSISLPAVLDDAEFVANSLSGLSVAFLMVAAAGGVKFADNRVTDCVGGIWFAAIRPTVFADAVAVLDLLDQEIPQGAAPAKAMVLAMLYPLPSSAAAAQAPATLPPQLHIVDNRIDAVPADGSASGPACLLYSTGSDEVLSKNAAATFDPTILLNSNQLRSYCGTGIAVAEVDTLTPLIGERVANEFAINHSKNTGSVKFESTAKSTVNQVVAGLMKAWNADPVGATLASASGGKTLTLTAKTPGFPLNLGTSVASAGKDNLTATITTAAVPAYGATACVLAAANIVIHGNLIHNLLRITETKLEPYSLFVGPPSATMAITGNVLIGATNIGALRSDVPAFSATSLANVPELTTIASWRFLNNAH